MFIAVLIAWRRYGAKIDFRASAKILIASSTTGLITFLFLRVFSASEPLRLIVGTALFVAIYLVISPLIGAINKTDISSLRILVSNFGFAAKLLRIPIRFMEKILRK